MFEDILDGFKDLEDELEKELKQPGTTNVLNLDTNTGEWDTGKDNEPWDTGGGNEPRSDDKIWGV
jgi:hypothetical protein